MFGDTRLGYAQVVNELTHRTLAIPEEFHDPTPVGIGQDLESDHAFNNSKPVI